MKRSRRCLTTGQAPPVVFEITVASAQGDGVDEAPPCGSWATGTLEPSAALNPL